MSFSLVEIPPNFSVEKARRAQTRLAAMAVSRGIPRPVRFVCGVDAAYTENRSIGAAAALDYRTLATVEVKTAATRIRFPYIPSLLSFREIPPIVKAVKALRHHIDVFVVNGHGMLHPHRAGLATHFGVVLNAASIGVAKERLCGKVESFGPDGWAPIFLDGQVAGAAVRIFDKKKPVIVSVGNKVSLLQAIDIVRHCTTEHFMPEPIQVAHTEANKVKKRYIEGR